ncbi:hypothetical protein GCM10010344_79500 [Streptomyces bluensis]|nr:hypothetical protein GCM10010344_79500 [Streptomyces bluensis]
MSGGQLTDRARRQATKFGAEILTAREVTGLESSGAARLVRFSDGSQIAAHSVILATGVSYRQLEAPGADELSGRRVFYGSALTEAAACQGHDVYIVGCANSAGQAAMYLSRGAKSVTLLVRGADSPRRCRTIRSSRSPRHRTSLYGPTRSSRPRTATTTWNS